MKARRSVHVLWLALSAVALVAAVSVGAILTDSSSSASSALASNPNLDPGTPRARGGLGVARLESEPWCGTADASLLIDEIDRRRAGRGR
jgi:hypothetical protein